MSGPIPHGFVLVLGVTLYLLLNAIYKCRGIANIFPQEIFEVMPGYEYGPVVSSFKLNLMLGDFSMQKQSCKKDLIGSFGLHDFETIFILLVKPIAVYVQSSMIKV